MPPPRPGSPRPGCCVGAPRRLAANRFAKEGGIGFKRGGTPNERGRNQDNMAARQIIDCDLSFINWKRFLNKLRGSEPQGNGLSSPSLLLIVYLSVQMRGNGLMLGDS